MLTYLEKVKGQIRGQAWLPQSHEVSIAKQLSLLVLITCHSSEVSPLFTPLHGGVGQLLLVDLPEVDHLLHSALCDQTVHSHVSTLAYTECSAGNQVIQGE